MREAIVEDIINHRIESIEVGSGNEISPEEITELQSELSNMDMSELKHMWFSNVGEWIESMNRWSNDEYHTNAGPIWEQKGYDSVSSWQFEKLCSTSHSTDYGYISPIDIED